MERSEIFANILEPSFNAQDTITVLVLLLLTFQVPKTRWFFLFFFFFFPVKSLYDPPGSVISRPLKELEGISVRPKGRKRERVVAGTC